MSENSLNKKINENNPETLLIDSKNLPMFKQWNL